MLSNLITNATIYNNSIGQAPLAKSVSTVANQNINATIKLLNKNIRQFRLLLPNFATINSAFAIAVTILATFSIARALLEERLKGYFDRGGGDQGAGYRAPGLRAPGLRAPGDHGAGNPR